MTKLPMTADDPRHGTTYGYSGLRCRCDACRAAIVKYNREWRHRTGRSVPLAEYRARVIPVVHGTATMYTNHGCRCEECRRAYSDYQRSLRAAPCAAGCGRTVWSGYGASGLCKPCWGLSRRTAEHGTESLYHRGCRCEECRAASANGRRARRQQKKATSDA